MNGKKFSTFVLEEGKEDATACDCVAIDDNHPLVRRLCCECFQFSGCTEDCPWVSLCAYEGCVHSICLECAVHATDGRWIAGVDEKNCLTGVFCPQHAHECTADSYIDFDMETHDALFGLPDDFFH